MAIWQYALLALGLAWTVQLAGVWVQTRHYADIFKGVTNRFNDGYVGAGQVRGALRPGAIALVVVCPELVVRRVLLMSGRSVFAKFRRVEAGEGARLADVAARLSSQISKVEARALGQAVDQAARAHERAAREDNKTTAAAHAA